MLTADKLHFIEEDPCPCSDCAGTFEMTADDCQCPSIQRPTCWACENLRIACNVCGWVPGDELTAHEIFAALRMQLAS